MRNEMGERRWRRAEKLREMGHGERRRPRSKGVWGAGDPQGNATGPGANAPQGQKKQTQQHKICQTNTDLSKAHKCHPYIGHYR